MQAPSFAMDIAKSDFLVALCNSIKEGTAIMDIATMRIIFCNTAWQIMFETDFSGRTDMLHVEELRKAKLSEDEIRARIQAVEENGIFTEQAEYISRKGKAFWGELTVRAFTYQEARFYLLVIDRIDLVKETERQLAQDRQRFDALLEHASMGIIETNNRADIISINRFALNLFGYNKEEVLNQKIELLIPARFHSKHINHRDHYIVLPKNRPMGVGMDLYAMKKDGTEFPVEVSLSNYSCDNEQFVIAFVSDITIRKTAELEIKKLNDELEEAVDQRTKELKRAVQELQQSKEELSKSLEKEKELSELKSRFVSMASHEFRTPLSTVLSSAYLLEQYKSGEDQPKREKHLRRIISSVNMLTDILNDFLSVGRIEEGRIHVRYTEFDLEKQIRSIVEEIKNNFKKDQTIHFIHEGNALVSLDASLLKHIVMNLVSNASKFSPETGSIEVKSYCQDSSIVLSVKDYGIGISREDQKHLMERFFRGTNATNIQGTGLGLHIVAKYTELMNGTIECKSELKRGTEFIITFNTKNNHHHEKDSDN